MTAALNLYIHVPSEERNYNIAERDSKLTVKLLIINIVLVKYR